MAATGQPSNTAVILERIDQLRGDIAEIKSGMGDVTGWRREFEARYAKAHADVDNKASHAHLRIDEIKLQQADNVAQLKALRDAIQPMIYTNRILAWIGGLLGASIIGLIWALVVGQVTVVLP